MHIVKFHHTSAGCFAHVYANTQANSPIFTISSTKPQNVSQVLLTLGYVREQLFDLNEIENPDLKSFKEIVEELLTT